MVSTKHVILKGEAAAKAEMLSQRYDLSVDQLVNRIIRAIDQDTFELVMTFGVRPETDVAPVQPIPPQSNQRKVIIK